MNNHPRDLSRKITSPSFSPRSLNLYGNRRRRWTRQLVIDTIRGLERLNSYYIKKTNNALWRAGVRYFGSWGEAVEAAGFDYEQVKRQPGAPPANKGSGGVCKTEGCNRPHHARGYCQYCYGKHYHKQ